MALMRGKGPKDAVARMNPKFIRQKGQRLASPIGALRANAYLPLSLDQLRCDQYRQRQRPTEYRRKTDEVESTHLSLPEVVSSPVIQAEKVKARPRQPLAARYFLARRRMEGREEDWTPQWVASNSKARNCGRFLDLPSNA